MQWRHLPVDTCLSPAPACQGESSHIDSSSETSGSTFQLLPWKQLIVIFDMVDIVDLYKEVNSQFCFKQINKQFDQPLCSRWCKPWNLTSGLVAFFLASFAFSLRIHCNHRSLVLYFAWPCRSTKII